MLRHPRLARLVAATVIVGALGVAAVAPAGAGAGATVLYDQFGSPKGLTFDGNGQAIVSQGAFGPPAPLQRFFLSGPKTGTTQNLSADLGLNSVSYAAAKNSFWLLGGDGRLLRKPVGKFRVFVADLYDFAANNPDPYNTNGEPEESNPFNVAALPSGDALVADAAANSLLRVTPHGGIHIVARFASELVSTDHLPAGPPPFIDAESVPTSVAIGPDGAYYVGELKGFPFRPGSSRIWRIPAGTTGAVCSADPAVPAQNCTSAGDGYTSIASIAFGAGDDDSDGSDEMYVFEYAEEGVGVFEEQCFGPAAACPPAVLLEVDGDEREELAKGELYEPGTVAVSGDDVYVTDRVLTGGRLLVIDD
ncbi:MAG: ScyD/ScyE family protein [Acidimicrobiales bacterium]